MILENISIFLKVIISFLTIFLLVPYIIFRINKNIRTFDRIYMVFLFSNFLIINLVYYLAFIKLYETISIIVLYMLFAIFIYLKRTKIKRLNSVKSKLFVKFLDFIDRGNREVDFKEDFIALIQKIIQKTKHIKNKVENYIKKNRLTVIAVSIIFSYAFFVRFKHAFSHFYFASSDAYVVLAWTKLLGHNKVFVEGVYPYGYDILISSLSKIFVIDPIDIVSFIGGISGMLIVISIYFFTQRMFIHGKKLGILATFIYVFCSSVSFGETFIPAYLWRQISALSMEYSVAFILPGLYFFMMYFENTKDKKFILTAAVAFALTVLIHPYSALILGLCYFVVILFNFRIFIQVKIFKKIISYLFSAAVIGVAPLIIGLLSGGKFYASSAEYVLRKVDFSIKNVISSIPNFYEINLSVLFMLLCIIILAIYYIASKKNKYNRFENSEKTVINQKNIWIILVISILLYILYNLKKLGLPVLIDQFRIASYFAMFIAIVPVIVVDIGIFIPIKINNSNKKKMILIISSGLLIFVSINISSIIIKKVELTPVAIINNYIKSTIPEGNMYEYDEAAKTYREIKSEFPFRSWTIISTVEQYQQALDYGYHDNIWKFVKDVIVDKIPKYRIADTKYIFLFVEKYPLDNSNPHFGANRKKISKKISMLEFPKINGDLSSYYTEPLNRRIIEAKAYYWAEDFRKNNKEMMIYRDYNNMRIYQITQNENKPILFN